VDQLILSPGLRTGLWSKHRVNLGQEFVIGGYIPNNLGLDSIVFPTAYGGRGHTSQDDLEGTAWDLLGLDMLLGDPQGLASRRTRTLLEPFSLCDCERVRMRLNRMDDLTSHSEVVHCALCPPLERSYSKNQYGSHRSFDLRVREGLNHG
jgi:hypothetical protein